MAKGLNRFLYACAGIIGLAYLGSKLPDEARTSSSNSGLQTAAYNPPVQTKASLESLMPESQRAFLNAVRNGQNAYKAGQNEMAKGASRPARARELCAALKNTRAEGWVGTVYQLSSNNDGKGVLSVHLGNGIYVKTWNNSLSDISDNTLIDPDTTLFAKASSLRANQQVAFSGVLSKDRTDCFRESSMTISGSMLEPEFIMRFSQIGAIN